ncbi:uncharacterized protein MELLADRAFT_57889 [Melampsora larici-populina 98AG31]|uniref:Uncharacterized protein n=1 Tax=Melampsora larici-populina (strain 98AG31 / pathotype 3-4-7) TaxID=747676 RepID=F4S7X6_MELLP|nr:uncharacterized protein MELLADRAFT_57889 [Melampsora larici-populina 98AG31]EGF99186.1 hypothetical protein MELLADRAFT_57889 [Melampsora larici-populina 98AG31]
MPPPPPPVLSYQQTRDAEEARLRQAIANLRRNLDEARVAGNNPNFRQVLGVAKETHKELEDFLGGRRYCQKVEEIAGYNPYCINPQTMMEYEQPRPEAGPSSQCRKRARQEEIEELAETSSNLLDMMLMVKRMKQDEKRESDKKDKGKEKEQ